MTESTECNYVECNSIEASNLNNQQFTSYKINEIKDHFIAEIKERELMSKRLSKYIASFDYFDKLFYLQQVIVYPSHHAQQLLEHL